MGKGFIFLSFLFTVGFSSHANTPIDSGCVKLMEELHSDRLRARFASCMERRGADSCTDNRCAQEKYIRCTEYMFGFQYRTLRKLRIKGCYKPQT